MSYLYGICGVPYFCGKTACQKYFFQILSPHQKNVQFVNLKNPDLDLIQRIHPECGFYGFMIRFWICPKKTQNPVLDSEIRIWIFPKKRTQNPYFLPALTPALTFKFKLLALHKRVSICVSIFLD